MAKQTGALLAFDARGQLGKTIVFGSWRGQSYARRYVVPANPKTAAQTLTRSAFSWLQQAWKLSPTIFQAPWDLYASGQPFTNRNAFGSKNIAVLRSAADLSGLIFSPGAKGGIALATATFTAGVGLITVAGPGPAPPVGWPLAAIQAAVVRDQDPNTGVLYQISANEDLVSPYSFTITGLTAGQLYRCAAWAKWTKPNNTTAYGPQFAGSATPT